MKNLTDYGAFIDLGGMDGLLHITDISWGRIGHPSEKLSVGDRIKVKVLHFDQEKEKVSLGLKQALPDPWEIGSSEISERVPRTKGKVVNVTDYGVFVELEEGVEGLVHISELTWSKKTKHPSKVVRIGDTSRGHGPRLRPDQAPNLFGDETGRTQSMGCALRRNIRWGPKWWEG